MLPHDDHSKTREQLQGFRSLTQKWELRQWALKFHSPLAASSEQLPNHSAVCLPVSLSLLPAHSYQAQGAVGTAITKHNCTLATQPVTKRDRGLGRYFKSKHFPLVLAQESASLKAVIPVSADNSSLAQLSWGTAKPLIQWQLPTFVTAC